MGCHSGATLEHAENFFTRRARVEGGTDLEPRTRLAEVRAGAVKRQKDQLDFLSRQHAAVPRAGSQSQQQFRSPGIPFFEYVEGESRGVYRRCWSSFRLP